MQSATKPAGTHRTDQQLLNTVAQTGDTETSVPSSNLVKFINKSYVPNPTPLQSFFIERFTVTQDNRRR